MRGLEYYDLGNGELIVNVTNEVEIEEVKMLLSREWTWEAQEGPVVQHGEDGEEPTEWLTLVGARRLIRLRAAERMAA